MRGPLLVALLLAVPFSGCVGPLGEGGFSLFALAPIERGDPTPIPAADCDDLVKTMGERALLQARVNLEASVEGRGGYGGYGYHGGVDEMAMADTQASSAPAMAAGGGAGGSASKAQVTGTNNQEAAADEADMLKTDGEWTYVLAGDVLRILHSTDVGDVEAYSTVEVGATHGGQILLEARDPDDEGDDRLVLVLPNAAMPDVARRIALPIDEAPRQSSTRILVLSLADRRAPDTVDELWVEGDAAGARLVEGTAYVVVQARETMVPLRMHADPSLEDLAPLGLEWEDYAALSAENQTEVRIKVALAADEANQQVVEGLAVGQLLPRIAHAEGLHVKSGAVPIRRAITDDVCRTVYSTPDSTGRAVTTIVSLSVAQETVESATTQVVAASSIVYASADSLVLASSSQDNWWFLEQPELESASDLHWFDLDGLDVRLRASGRVPGIVMDSFALDVHEGTLRVVSATGTFNRGWMPDGTLETMVTVFDELAGQLVPRVAVVGIAPGERLWSVRFTDDRAYIVTFDAMDPLFVVDLTGTIPEVLGELKVEGVSTYIHPLRDDFLITIGYGGGDNGLGLDESRILVSLFDVRKPNDPRQLDVLDLSPPGGGSWSTALHEHKAFTYWDDIGTLAVPVSSYSDGRYGGSSHVGLDLIDVDPGRGTLQLRGAVNHDRLGTSDAYGAQVERSYFLGDPDGAVSVYSVSPLGVTAHDLETLKLQGHVAFR